MNNSLSILTAQILYDQSFSHKDRKHLFAFRNTRKTSHFLRPLWRALGFKPGRGEKLSDALITESRNKFFKEEISPDRFTRTKGGYFARDTLFQQIQFPRTGIAECDKAMELLEKLGIRERGAISTCLFIFNNKRLPTFADYEFKQSPRNGGWYASSKCLPNPSKAVRACLGLPEEYDAVNCMPAILEAELEALGVPCPETKDYNSNRDEILKEDPKAKKKAIAKMFGSKKHYANPRFQRLQEEIKMNQDRLIQKYTLPDGRLTNCSGWVQPKRGKNKASDLYFILFGKIKMAQDFIIKNYPEELAFIAVDAFFLKETPRRAQIIQEVKEKFGLNLKKK